ncbi:MAG: hypothetical protein HY254_19895 [Burkholderiales bacterium]|nr:hypothetical protein [Burkholderiales bacterium]
MLLTEVQTAHIPEIYEEFCSVIGENHWKKRVANLNQEIKGNRFLKDFLYQEYNIAYQLENLRELKEKFHYFPPQELNNRSNYAAVSFAAQSLSIIKAAPKDFSEKFKRRIHGAFKNPGDMRGLRLEIKAATHFTIRGLKISWPEMTGIDRFDLLVEGLGTRVLEIECKSISSDKGRKIHQREILDFYNLLMPELSIVKKSLSTGLAAVLTIPGRLPTQYKDRRELARRISSQILIAKNTTFIDGAHIRFSEFDLSMLDSGNLKSNQKILRETIDSLTGTLNREAMLIGTSAGGAFALVIQSEEDDKLLSTIFDTLSDSAKKQFSRNQGGMFLVGLHGISADQLTSIATQDNDSSQQSSALRIEVSEFLSSNERDHVIGVGFLSENDLPQVSEFTVESSGSAYFFPKKESSLWSNDFSNLFNWRDSEPTIQKIY